ncbi:MULTISPECIES: lasso peptide biosynthesis B2 protein [unclassified Sphingobium]|uniref:lasso peptide biosynthesis B2 protein n=1 Tax=unclassified Sphingobium TaxID=2611147 RepID=UPI00257CD9BA|nr:MULTISPECIES: lasso peptide biosynthesis B2 protein [unclassified Sphingobium]
MRYQLREGLFHCIAGQSVIFLDLPKNRYFALPAPSTQAFRHLVARNGEKFVGAEEALSSLIEAGYLIEDPVSGGNFNNPAIEIASDAILESNQRKFAVWEFLVALYWELLTSLKLRLFPLSSILERIGISRGAQGSGEEMGEVQIARWVSAFDQTALILGRTDRCLVRSLAMFSILRGHGVSAALVIGVRSDPFSAHAWVQHDDIVLNDSVDQINNYAPILVLR